MAADRRRWRSTLLALVLPQLLGSAPAAAEPQPADYVVVTHPATPVGDVTFGTLRRIYLGEQQFWPDGRRVVIFIQPAGSPARQVVLRALYRMDERTYTQYWIARIFRDQVRSGPRIVASSQSLLQLAGSVPGAIAVIPAAEADPRVKVLRVDGLLPGAPGYQLAERPR